MLALYARLSAAEQDRVFRPGPQRRIVLATNVAETSITVPGIRFVIDSGLARISRYSPGSRLQRLPIDAVPDITNNQVQVNVLAPSLSPDQIERQVSYIIETSLAGIPGLENTRSLNRNQTQPEPGVPSEPSSQVGNHL